MEITNNDILNFSPSRHCMDIGSICGLWITDGVNGTDTEVDYSKLNAGSREQFEKNQELFEAANINILSTLPVPD